MNQSLQSTSGGAATPTIYANKDVRFAVAEALNKQGYIDAFYAGAAKAPQSWLPAGTTGYKAENMPAYDVNAAKASLAKAGLSADKLKIDLYYPSNVVRPYMPDPKSLAQAIAGDLQRPASPSPQDRGLARRLRQPCHGRQLPLFLFGWTCDWAAPTTSSTRPGSAGRMASPTCSSGGRIPRSTR